MKYFTRREIEDAIGKLASVHPFFQVTPARLDFILLKHRRLPIWWPIKTQRHKVLADAFTEGNGDNEATSLSS